MIDTVIILAGGLGTRLQSVLPNTPKCLAPINNTPFLGKLLVFFKKQGINNFILSLGYRSELVIKYISAEFSNYNIKYSIENQQLGTGGAIKLALSNTEAKEVLIVNGDTFFNNDIRSFYNFHKQKSSNFSIAITKIENNNRYGSVSLDNEKKIINFSEKNNISSSLINSGQYIVNKKYFLSFNTQKIFSLELDFFQNVAIDKIIYGFEYNSDFIDIGIPVDLIRAQTFFK